MNELLKVGVISAEEFEFKKDKLYTETKQFLIDKPYSIKGFNTLEDWQKRSIRDLYKNRNVGDSYWFKRGTNSIISFSKEEVDGMKATGTLMYYYYIEMPLDFDPKTIK